MFAPWGVFSITIAPAARIGYVAFFWLLCERPSTSRRGAHQRATWIRNACPWRLVSCGQCLGAYYCWFLGKFLSGLRLSPVGATEVDRSPRVVAGLHKLSMETRWCWMGEGFAGAKLADQFAVGVPSASSVDWALRPCARSGPLASLYRERRLHAGSCAFEIGTPAKRRSR